MTIIRKWEDIDGVPKTPCEYKLFRGNELVRNGSSCNCNRRLKEHRRAIPEATGFKVQLVDSCRQARIIERVTCQVQKPPMNKRCG